VEEGFGGDFVAGAAWCAWQPISNAPINNTPQSAIENRNSKISLA
jgi:hypothetical protein